MKTLILYATKTGTTKKCAALLAANLGADSCELWDLADGMPELSGYDALALGSYLRMGVVDKRLSAFLEKRKAEILEKPFGLFLCGCVEEKVSEAIAKNFKEEFLEKARCVEFFGGELSPEKCKGLEKLIVRALHKIAQKDQNFVLAEKIRPEAITSFAEELKKA